MGVEQVDPLPASPGRVKRGDSLGDWSDGEAGAREAAEPVLRLAVENLRGPRRPIKQCLGRGDIEPRVGAQEAEKAGEAATNFNSAITPSMRERI